MYQEKNSSSADNRREQAAENFEKIQRTIAPYIHKPVVETPAISREWESTDKHITSIDQLFSY